jgi:ABC-type lipopolysaccharide export system ATPase subunit
VKRWQCAQNLRYRPRHFVAAECDHPARRENALLALEAAHRTYVAGSGAITLSGEAKSLLHDARIRDAYLGEAHSA